MPPTIPWYGIAITNDLLTAYRIYYRPTGKGRRIAKIPRPFFLTAYGEVLFALQLLHADIVAREEEQLVFAEQAAGDAVFVASLELLARDIGVDHGLLAVV